MKKIKIGDCFKNMSDPSDIGVFEFQETRFARLRRGEKLSSFTETELMAFFIPLPTLHLPIGNSQKYGGCWFDMILSGVKKEEYREVSKHYQSLFKIQFLQTTMGKDYYSHCDRFPYKVLHLTKGYGHDKPQLWAHIESISIGRGNPEWGAPTDRDVFIIRLGDVFHTKNLKK